MLACPRKNEGTTSFSKNRGEGSVNLRNRCLLKKKRLKAVVISVFSQILLGRRFRKRVNRVNYLMELGEEVASGRDQSGTIMAIMPLSTSLSLSPFDAIVSRTCACNKRGLGEFNRIART